MKHTVRRFLATFLFVATLGSSTLPSAIAEGIPEPFLILYGTVRNTAVNNERLTLGSLTWRFRSQTTGQELVFTVPVTNLLDQFSYVLRVPCEQVISLQLSTKALNLTGTSVLFDRSLVIYDGIPARFVRPEQPTVMLSVRNRGQVERVDLEITEDCVDWDQNGLCDEWELYYLGYLGADLNDDPDGDGQSNWAEFKAGTDPLDPQSVFQFLNYERVDSTRIRVDWQSADGRFYSLLRYPNLLSTNYTVVQDHIFATTPVTTWMDTNVPPTGTWFYRVLLEP